MKLNAYLNFGGNCEQAFRFYEQHLGGQITMMMRRAEQPNQPATWSGWEQSIQYATMKIGETELMGADVDPARFQPMRSVYLSLTVDGRDEADAQRQVRDVVDDSGPEGADSVTLSRDLGPALHPRTIRLQPSASRPAGAGG